MYRPTKRQRTSGSSTRVRRKRLYLRRPRYGKPAGPARFAYSRKRYRKTTAVSNLLAGMAERKYRAWIQKDEDSPSAIQLGALAYYVGYVSGLTAPVAWTGFNTLGGFQYAQGSGDTSRDGRYMYLDHSTINCSVHMNAQSRNSPPTQFRCIVFKARRATTPTGISYDPAASLFLDTNGNSIGHATSGVNGNDLMLQPLNKRSWIILQDKKFTLQAPMQDGTTETASFQGKYPSFKQMRITLKHGAKALYQNSTDEPVDFDFHYGIVIYAASVGRDAPASPWEFNLRGTTSAFDN